MKKAIRLFLLLSIMMLLAISIVACNKPTNDDNNGDDGGEVKPPQTHTITYFVDGGILGLNSPQTHTDGQDTTLVDASKTGYSFIGWYLSDLFDGNAITILSGGNTEFKPNITLYAKWDANVYHISYVLNGGELGENSPTTHTYGTDTPLVRAVKAGYISLGWHTDSNLSGNHIDRLDGNSYTADITLYAEFSADEYNIIYNLDGGQLGENSPTTHTYGTDTTLVAPIRDGYTFDGWFDDSNFDGNVITVLGANEYLSNINLYAKWTGEAYNVSFQDIEGNDIVNDTLPAITHTNGTTTQLPKFDKNGLLDFGGWSTAMYGGGTIYISNNNTIPTIPSNAVLTQDITLYVYWSSNLGDSILTYTLLDSGDSYEVSLSNISAVYVYIEVQQYYAGLPVSKIADDGFNKGVNGSDSIKQIIMPQTIVEIGNNSFKGCNQLSSINIPKSVKYIDSKAFYGNTKLAQVEFEQGSELITLGQQAFYNCDNLVTINLEQTNLVSIEKSAFSFDTYTKNSNGQLYSIVLPRSLQTIGEGAFMYRGNLKNIALMSGTVLKTIEKAAFYDCRELESFVIPSTVTTIGITAFQNYAIANSRISIYTEVASKPSGWDNDWLGILNLQQTVIWSCSLDSDETIYVKSFESDNINKIKSGSILNSPFRDGYNCLGFNDGVNTYGPNHLDDMIALPSGTILAPVWNIT